ncbi:hypothetical protein [Streptomyces sp. NPDC029674]|uniref:hypothetical protein n=1 Tax=Streptomyces sp. NPDC029674 TaxID=3365297 RepID=UPI00384B052B
MINEGIPCLHQLSSRFNQSRTVTDPPSLSDQTVDRGNLSLQRRDQAERAAGSNDAGDRALPSDLTDEVVDLIRDALHVNVSAFVDLLSSLSERAGNVGGGLQKISKGFERAGSLLVSLSLAPSTALQIHVAQEREGDSGKSGGHGDHLPCYVSHSIRVQRSAQSSQAKPKQSVTPQGHMIP